MNLFLYKCNSCQKLLGNDEVIISPEALHCPECGDVVFYALANLPAKVIREDRRGKFFITRDIIEREYETIRLVLSNCLVYKANFSDFGRTIEYEAFGSYFDPVEEGTIAPTYNIYFTKTMNKDESVIITHEFKRID